MFDAADEVVNRTGNANHRDAEWCVAKSNAYSNAAESFLLQARAIERKKARKCG
jgi:hypothetical protein